MATLTTVALHLRGTHWETPSLAQAGWVERPYDLDPRETGFIALHLWSVGDVNGPAVPDRYLVDMGLPETQAESIHICERYIRPAIDASRAAGLAIFHVEPYNIARQYDSHRYLLDDDELPSAARAQNGAVRAANPGWQRERAERTHGRGYQEWDGWGRMRIAASCEPEADDQVIVTGRQLDRICRRRGIKNLVYTGFATNMCIMHSAAATVEMLVLRLQNLSHPRSDAGGRVSRNLGGAAGDADGHEGVPTQDRRYHRLRAIHSCLCRRRRGAAARGLVAARLAPQRPSPAGRG